MSRNDQAARTAGGERSPCGSTGFTGWTRAGARTPAERRTANDLLQAVVAHPGMAASAVAAGPTPAYARILVRIAREHLVGDDMAPTRAEMLDAAIWHARELERFVAVFAARS